VSETVLCQIPDIGRLSTAYFADGRPNTRTIEKQKRELAAPLPDLAVLRLSPMLDCSIHRIEYSPFVV
jgi:hypothetical protein